jgi:hypothetical protein
MASLFETRTLAPLLEITTTIVSQLADLEPAVKLLETELVTENTDTMDTIWQTQADTVNLNGSWLGQVWIWVICLIIYTHKHFLDEYRP